MRLTISSNMAMGIKTKVNMQSVLVMASAEEHTSRPLYAPKDAEERERRSWARDPEVNSIGVHSFFGFCKSKGHNFDDCPKVKAHKENGTWDYSRRRVNNGNENSNLCPR